MTLLTKSRFQIASDCPRKLYYHGHSERYANKKNDDEFMRALAKGGHQVGALARTLYPTGTLITSLDPDEACRQTSALLQQPEAIIFEAAIQFEQFFIRKRHHG